MPDREKVIRDFADYEPYARDLPAVTIKSRVYLDALSLLKEQEPVAPVLFGRMWECGKCHAPVGIFMDDRRDQFCRTCGRAVEWYD